MGQRIEYTLIVKTVPEISKRDGGVFTCSIGYSPQLGFIRLYPLPMHGMKRWGKYELEVEKNKRDSRAESWKLASYTRYEQFVGFEKDVIYKGQDDKESIIAKMQALAAPSIGRLNEQRKSIGFVLSSAVKPYWQTNERFINTKQIGLFEDVEISDFCKYTKETKERESRITFIDGDGKHDLQLNDWQYYEYQRRFGATDEAFRFINKSEANILVLGNMYSHRNVWLALGVHKAINQGLLF